jgi:hypothetical protein
MELETKNEDCNMQKWNIHVQVKGKYKRSVTQIKQGRHMINKEK